MKDHVKDVISQVTGFLMAILLFLGTVNIEYKWFTEASISAVGLVLTAGTMLVINLYTIYRNHYGFTDKAKKEKSMIDDLNRPK
jgi:hypothetical protein